MFRVIVFLRVRTYCFEDIVKDEVNNTVRKLVTNHRHDEDIFQSPMHSHRRYGWTVDTWKTNSFTFIVVFVLYGIVHKTGADPANPAGPTGCQNLNPSQLERRLRDEGDFDTRYMAPDIDSAVERFADLADAKFIREAEPYTCDSECVQRTNEIRDVFAKYGQIPTTAAIPDFNIGPSFADIREVLEGHLAPQPAPQTFAGSQPWTGVFLPSPFVPPNPPEQPRSILVPSQLQPPPPPAPAPPQQQQFQPVATQGFTMAPPVTWPVEQQVEARTETTVMTEIRWLTPGDLVNDEPLHDAGMKRRRKRKAPVSSTSIGQSMKIRCSKKGQEERSGLNLLCGSCRVIRELPAGYYPRYINEISCSSPSCFDKSASGQGRCVEQFINFDILRNSGTNECQKWGPVTIAIPVCCNCLMSDALARFLMMSWNGQKQTTGRNTG